MTREYKSSIQQDIIYDWVKNGSGNAIIQAVAGSGKTTTLIKIGELIPKYKKRVFVSFNKSVIKKLITSGVSEAKTLHSLGWGFMTRKYGTQFDEYKVKKLISDEIKDIPQYYQGQYAYFLKEIISKIKNSNTDYNNLTELEELRETYNISEEPIEDRMMTAIHNIMEKNNKDVKTMDYDDELYLPVVKNIIIPNYDWILVDESQDLNKIQFEFIERMRNELTRVVVVGDQHQSIYAFRGADIDSMKNFKEKFNCVEFPLSVSYRLPKSHIRLIKMSLPEINIEAADDAEEGIIDDINSSRMIDVVKEGDVILCRTNSPLVKVVLTLNRNGKKAIIKGNGMDLNILINRMKANNIDDLYSSLNRYKNKHQEDLDKMEDGDKNRFNVMANIDKAETILNFMQGCSSIYDVIQKINNIFSDAEEGVIICSTVHKFKGGESNTVFIINRDKMPHPLAKTFEEIQQEENILYVALSRSKHTLYLIKDIIK